MSAERAKRQTLSLRLSDATRALLEHASTAGPYELSFTAIIERGILLAAREIDEMAKREPSP